ncbi:helix-turn-helix domain-containing protein [Asticcacaulis sp. AC466]|uniref:helix-turn-helix domain-containing protein n=1 Tax=Asticcacaulis sp. AC466 TaxID=1282362 RepID=UPI0012DD8896|nr:helix-turn-helix transcriptional regulator [Asticcacaulis sp. AC466]
MKSETKSAEARVPRVYPYKEFGERLKQACDGNPDVPEPNYGRLGWFVEKLANVGVTASAETVRKWFAGETFPRAKAIDGLARILQVDLAWLTVGHGGTFDAREKKVRNALADGIVNVVAGFIQMHGGSPAFPEPNDKRARSEAIDLYTVIRGAQYAFQIALGTEDGDGVKFSVRPAGEGTFILGAVASGDFSIEIIEIDHEGLAEVGTRKNGLIELRLDKTFSVKGRTFNVIKNFRERL